MYHCNIRIYFVGCPNQISAKLKEITPFENFTYEFFESDFAEESLIKNSDIIFAD